MKILLVQGYLGGYESPAFPLGPSCLARSIKGHHVKIFDPNVSQCPHEDFRLRLTDLRPDVVGISPQNIQRPYENRGNALISRHREWRNIIVSDAGEKTLDPWVLLICRR